MRDDEELFALRGNVLRLVDGLTEDQFGCWEEITSRIGKRGAVLTSLDDIAELFR